MKKNKFMKLASGLLVLCLMTTCVIGATLAKYTTSNSSSDTAHVAKWGVSITAAADPTFKTEYAADTTTYTAGATVKSNSSEAVVAPGTTGTAAQFAITGTPEVAVKLTFAMTDIKDVFLASGNADLGEDYYPIEFKLTHNSTELKTGKLSEIATFLSTYTVEFEAGKDLSTEVGTYTLSWTWAFENSKDKADTLLGDLMAGTKTLDSDQYSTKVSYTLTITATQID